MKKEGRKEKKIKRKNIKKREKMKRTKKELKEMRKKENKKIWWKGEIENQEKGKKVKWAI